MSELLSPAEAKKRSVEIDKMLRDDARQHADTRRILLLGTSESGKSTVLKQMRLIANESLIEGEPGRRWLHTLQLNVVRGVVELIAGATSVGMDVPENEHTLLLGSLDPSKLAGTPIPMPEEWREAVLAVYNSPFLALAFTRRHEFSVIDNSSYWYPQVPRIMEANARLTNEDVINARLETMGCSETRLQMYGLDYKVYDVPGNRAQRHAWVPFFDDANVILFVVATSSYDQMLPEDSSMNRLTDAMMVFEEIVNNKLLDKTAIILFLNKIDLLREKFDATELVAHFPDYAPSERKEDDRVEHALRFMAKKFYFLNKVKERKLYVHNTCATDTKQARVLLATVNKIVIKLNLQNVRSNLL
ncbi:guanine nucleotide binding protein, alpha subunit [Blastocladiella britannica]|nr:guanine nucleotide binding protein, alpha subunit [Blastocladiella britannica]